MAMNTDAWYETAYISVAREGGSEVELRAKTRTFSQSGGGFDVEGIEVFGGKLKRVGSTDDVEIKFDVIPVGAEDFDALFYGMTGSTQPIQITSNTATKLNYRVTLLWTNQIGITSATQAINTSSEAYRKIFANCNMTGWEPKFDAGDYLQGTITFKTPVVDATGGGNIKIESCDTTSALSTVPAYTTTTKF